MIPNFGLFPTFSDEVVAILRNLYHLENGNVFGPRRFQHSKVNCAAELIRFVFPSKHQNRVLSKFHSFPGFRIASYPF